MKTVDLDYTQFSSITASKGLLVQYKETADRYEVFAIESNISWETSILKDGGNDVTNFEANVKSMSNKPLEYRSSDGLLKTASAKFVDALTLYVDGENGLVSVNAGETGYSKTHYAFSYTLSGVDVSWEGATNGDYVDFEVGVYLGATEADFYTLQKFGNKYRMKGPTGSRIFDVPTVKVIPSTVTISGNTLDVYIRAKVVSLGTTNLTVCVNLVGWKA